MYKLIASRTSPHASSSPGLGNADASALFSLVPQFGLLAPAVTSPGLSNLDRLWPYAN